MNDRVRSVPARRRRRVVVDPTPTVYTAADVQRILQIGRSAAYGLIQRGDIRSVKIGSRVRVRSDWLDEYLEREASDGR